MTDDRRRAEGARIRSEVLGADYAERSLERASDFSRPMHEFSTDCCWGTVWARDGLGRRERSLINVAILAALNRSPQLGVHVRAAVRNGCTREEIQEALLQVAVYCGVPAGMEGFRVAEAALEQLEGQ